MKLLISSLALAGLLSNPWVALGQNSLDNDPGYLAIDKAVDLKVLRPEVNVNLPRFLIKDALSSFNGGAGDPLAGTGIDLADLVKDIKLIRVMVIEANKNNHEALDKSVAVLRKELEAKWTPLVTVSEDNIGIYARSSEDGEKMAGLALLINDGGDAVIANIVGQVALGKMVSIAAKFDKIPKDLLKKLAEPAQAKDGKAEPAKEKTKQKSPESKSTAPREN